RAHAAVVVGENTAGVEADVRRHADIPLFCARLEPDAGNPDVAGKRIFAFAGIGRPGKFRETLEAAGAVIDGWGAFPVHYAYAESDLREIFAAADDKVMPVFTTAKDHVLLPPAFRHRA